MSELSTGTFETIGSLLPAGVLTLARPDVCFSVATFVDVRAVIADAGIVWGFGAMVCESKFVDGRNTANGRMGGAAAGRAVGTCGAVATLSASAAGGFGGAETVKPDTVLTVGDDAA